MSDAPARAGAASTTLVLRELDRGADDDAAVISVFTEAFTLGRPAPEIERFDAYASLCLGWYLGPGRRDARVVADSATGEVLGYALVCADEAAHRRWATARTLGFSAATLAHLVVYGMSRTGIDFYRSRAGDAADLRRTRRASPMPMHAHLNVRAGHRSGRAAVILRDHIDACCGAHGSPGWWAEMNASRGRRAAALERLGLEVVARTDSRTMSSLCGTAVERLTLVRRLPQR